MLILLKTMDLIKSLEEKYPEYGSLKSVKKMPSNYDESFFSKLLEDYEINHLNQHDLSKVRKYWLWKWLGLEHVSPNPHLFRNLSDVWMMKDFHPFIGRDEAKELLKSKKENYLQSMRNTFVLIRLSTTVPGTISVTGLRPTGLFNEIRIPLESSTNAKELQRRFEEHFNGKIELLRYSKSKS